MKLLTAATVLSVAFTTTVYADAQEPPEFAQAKQAVLAILKDPDSARFGKLFAGQGANTICGEVNARNGFGGYNGMKPFAYVINTGETEIITINEWTYNEIKKYGLRQPVTSYFRDCRSKG